MSYPSICTVDGCESDVLAKGLCSVHYGRMRKYGTTELPAREISLCEVDGCDSVVRCKGLCGKHYQRFKTTGSVEPTLGVCEICGKPYASHGKSKWCDTCKPVGEQRYQHAWYLNNLDHATKYAKERARRPEVVARRQEWMDENRPSVRQWTHRRRARIRGGGAFVVSARDYARCLSRCGDACVYCGVALDVTTVTWDHVVPLFRGGRHSIGNLLPACKSCNSSKRCKTYLEFRVWRSRVLSTAKAA